ncbi:MAG: MFS transporter [Clostridia bacterium]|nr:MFS transporter [Clostridia bacterium]
MRVKSLDKKWKEFLFAFSGFGPNLLMVLMGAYFTDAINPVALADGSFQAISSGVCFILPAIFPILHALGKVFDGIIDIPFAHITDSLSTKWGRRRPAIAVCILPMIISFALCWLPIGGAENPLLNTIWIAFWELIFFATYTMCLIAFYGSLSSVCESESQRLRVSGYKSFFDTISYCLVYALVPLLLDVMQINIDKFVFLLLPAMLTITIPLFMIKEGEKYGYPENDGLNEEKVTLKESLVLTFKNKTFLNWLLVNCCTFFGLQMFLVGMNAMIIGGMGFNGAEMALVNTCAFAPVPIMLYLFNKLKAKKGIRFTYQTCLVAFGVAILSFFFASTFVMGTNNKPLQYLIASVGGVVGSWAIGAFFMMPYMISAQISAVEEKIIKKNHSAMYFAANAVVTSIVGAISGSLVYENIKMLFISKDASGIVWAESFASAAQIFSQKANAVISSDQVFNFGTLLVPFIVCAVCILGAILAQRMPKDYTPYLVAKELKKHNPDLDISNIEQSELYTADDEKGEIIFVQVGLSILSGFIFGFIWLGYLLKSIKELTKCKCNNLVKWLICSFIPFANIYFTVKMHEQLNQILLPNGKKATGSTALFIILGILFPILPINVVCLSLLQSSVNKAYSVQEDCKVANLTGAIEA